MPMPLDQNLPIVVEQNLNDLGILKGLADILSQDTSHLLDKPRMRLRLGLVDGM
ncbi:hypothetical protein HAP99_03925 [Acidithiobacillus caldus]|uniref:hypothetical protein n=1 Tax=Acidithiobacillus caldus TaxID=33059 RepID=UPI001C074E3F|nr:hypothetical protein [Acidithiobacillus caldus]MBU2782328.1 hypothetical protein [Acidithiobacillus caldus]